MASTCFRLLRCQLRHFTSKTYRCVLLPSRKRQLTMVATGVAFCQSKSNENDKTKDFKDIIQPPDPSTLTTEYLLRNASLVVIDAAVTLLTQTTTTLLDTEKEYCKALDTLVTLMEFKLTILDKEKEVTTVWDYILQVRAKLNRLKRKQQNLKMMHTTATNLLSNAAEAAFMTGSEYKGILANEVLRSSELELQQSQKRLVIEEKRLQDMELQTIKVESQYAEEQEKKKNQAQKDREAETVEKENSKSNDPKSENKQEEKSVKNTKHFTEGDLVKDMEQIFDTEEEWQKAQRESEEM